MSDVESEADEGAESAAADAGRDEIWVEKYRPQTLDEVAGHEDITARLKRYVERDDLPNLLFSGPAGVGKCVTGDTPVVTNRGVERIDSVVGDVEGFADPDDGLEVLTLDERGDFEYATPAHVFGKQAEELVEVTTRDGGEMEVTPEHRLLVLTRDGLEWKRAEDLHEGDRIARPLRTPTPDDDSELDWIGRMDGDRTLVHVTEEFAVKHDIPAEENWVGTKKQVFGRLRRGESVEGITDELDTPRKTVREYQREAEDIELDATPTVCSLAFLRELDCSRSELREHVRTVQYVTRYNKRSPKIVPPWSVTPRLATFVGLAVSEARTENGRIKFYNSDDGLLRQFEQSAIELFDADVAEGVQRGVPYREVNTRSLTHLLESCFDAFSSDGDTEGIGSALVTADEESRAAFLRAVFDAEAHVTQNGIVELTQKDEGLITLLSYLLASFGIPSRRKTDHKRAINGSETSREYHTLYVSGERALARFEDAVGFTMDEKSSRLRSAASKDGNPNHDTIVVQDAVDDLTGDLHLPKGELLTDALNPESPGRENYVRDLDAVLDAATAKLETAQEALQRLDEIAANVDSVAKTPATWIGERERLEPLELRKDVESETGIRSDYLLEYADGRRTPTAERTCQLLVEVESVESPPPVERIQHELTTIIEELNVPYERVADETRLRGTDVINLLESDDHDLSSLTRFSTVTERVREVAESMLSQSVLETIQTLDTIANADLYYDTVESVETVAEERRVFDLTVPETRNYVAGSVPTVMHNTTSAVAIAKELYGDDWEQNFMELNASDQRGIDVVRDRIKNFARSSFGGYNYRVIFLDEADSLCVPPGTEVVTGYPSKPEVKPIEEVAEDGEPIPSVDFETNEVQSDKGKLVDSGVADFFEVELSDGRTIEASLTHPFFVVGEDGRLVEKELAELSPGDEIADFGDDIGVSKCKICEDWTAGTFCSVDCKNEGHSREMQGRGNPMHGTEWSDERREQIVEKLSDGRLEGENNPNYGGDFHGVRVWEMDEETVEQCRETISELRSGTPWDEWVVDADAESVKENIGEASAEWWDSLDEDEKARLIEKSVENCDYPVCDITGDNNPMRDPEVARKVSEALKGHEPTGGNIRHSDELGHLVRSDWEYDVAKALQDAGIEYEYEPAFELSDSVLHPDFLIDDTVVEVKGVAELWGQTEKVEEFLETYGDDYTFVVVGDGELPHHEHYEKDEFEPALVADGGLQTVQTATIRRIEHSHRGKAYNISMEDTPNFMLGNGILTHNTSDAQSALRRTMEQFSSNTRFILSCNYSSKIIDPIQSRCATFRFGPLSDEAVAAQVEKVAAAEGIETTEDGVDALVYAADGDMRKAINALQAAAVMGEVVDEEAVFTITSTARPEEIEEMVTHAIAGDFSKARSILDDLLTDKGMAGGDIIDQLHRSVWEFDLDDADTVRLMDRVGEVDYRITEGANEQVQLEALLASLSLDDE